MKTSGYPSSLLPQLRHIREAWELGHSIFVYYANLVSQRHGMELDYGSIRSKIPHKSEADVLMVKSGEMPPRKDDNGQLISYPFDEIEPAHNVLINNLRIVAPRLAPTMNLNRFHPWVFGGWNFPNGIGNMDYELTEKFRMYLRVGWEKENWRNQFADPMKKNADEFRSWFDYLDKEATYTYTQSLDVMRAQLIEYAKERETSVPNELFEPQSIRGTDLFSAVQRIERLREEGKLPTVAWEYWKGILERVEEGKGERKSSDRYAMVYKLVDKLVVWIDGELANKNDYGDGEWTIPMSKSEIAKKIAGKSARWRSVQELFKPEHMHKVSDNKWMFNLDVLPKNLKQKVLNAS